MTAVTNGLVVFAFVVGSLAGFACGVAFMVWLNPPGPPEDDDLDGLAR